jgi:hypothetical protein
MLHNYLLTLGPYALLCGGFVVGLCIFLALKNEIRRLRSGLDGRDSTEAMSALDLKLQLDQVSERLRDAEERAGTLVAAPAAKSGLNISKRSQAMRMSRRGAQAGNIAASLSLPRREVELLLKIQSMVLNSTSHSTS